MFYVKVFWKIAYWGKNTEESLCLWLEHVSVDGGLENSIIGNSLLKPKLQSSILFFRAKNQ